jgi:hypothetical protein
LLMGAMLLGTVLFAPNGFVIGIIQVAQRVLRIATSARVNAKVRAIAGNEVEEVRA